MTSLSDFFAQMEHSTVATTIRDSTILTGTLSGLHLIGLTLITGSVLVSVAVVAGWIVNDQPVAELTRAARRASIVGLIVSVTSGVLLLSFRVAMTTSNRAFQIKMLMLAVAAVFHFAVFLPVARGRRSFLPPKLAGAFGFVLWFGVVLGGCAFILFE